MAEFHIRRARVADASRIAEIHIAAWRAAYRGIMADEVLDRLDHERITANWARNLGDETNRMISFVAVFAASNSGASESAGSRTGGEDGSEGPIAGFGGVCPPRDSSEVLDRLPDASNLGQLAFINFHPETFGTGAASVLIRALEAALRDAGFAQAYLMVAEGNDRAMRFYEKHGWARTDITPVYEGVTPAVPERLYLTSL